MVDPDRKINRLDDKLDEFVERSELEFEKRFTNDDKDLKLHCAKEVHDPPVVGNWFENTGRGDNYKRTSHNYSKDTGPYYNHRRKNTPY